jgi:glycosyltransferase involved in cell wall biosynthesis
MKNNNKVSIYVRNEEITPSAYYRIIQYAYKLEGKIEIHSMSPTEIYRKNIVLDKSYSIKYFYKSIFYYLIILIRCTYYLVKDNLNVPDCVLISKYIIPRYMPIFVGMLLKRLMKKSRVYWDFDDYIFNNKPFSNQDKILGIYSKNIIVTNNFLKSKLLPEWQNKVILLPTTDGDLQGFDEEKLMKFRCRSYKKQIKLVWVATKGNLIHLINIIDCLDKAAEILKTQFEKELILTVVCNGSILYDAKYLQIINIQWTREVAKREIYRAHIGIMPLIKSEFALGKGGFKLVQYISAGLPVIASSVGYNKEIVDEHSGILVDDLLDCHDWVNAIITISLNIESWKNLSIGAYNRWNDNFSYDKNLNFWNDLINESI